jgi:hypothetical protein
MSANIQELLEQLVQLYYKIYPTMDKIPVCLIITDNLNKEHCKIRPDYEQFLKESDNDYNGRLVTPMDISGVMTILMNLNSIQQYTNDGSLTWVGTFAHELTHAIDYYSIAKKEQLLSYKPLETLSSYQTFRLWSEYHARKLGYNFLRTYMSNVVGLGNEQQQIDYIVNTEWPFHKNNYYQDYHSNSDGNQQMYITMQLLGRYSVWCDLFPNCFNEDAFCAEYSENPWAGHLFSFLRCNESLDDVSLHFNEMESILEENWELLI